MLHDAKMPSLKDKLRMEEEARLAELEKLEEKVKDEEVKAKVVKKTTRNKKN